MKFERKEKYIVIKIDDINDYLVKEDVTNLKYICGIIDECRRRENKKINSYIVVNQDESYSKKVWKLIENSQK